MRKVMQQNKNQIAYHKQGLHEKLADALLLQPDDVYDSDLDRQITKNDISVEGRLSIYKHNVLGGLIEVIMQRYALVAKCVGDEFARAMARDYILQAPPSSGNLNDYGQDYPNFIKTFEAAKSVSYLPDLAYLENLEHLAYYASEGLVLNLTNAAEYLPLILQGDKNLTVQSSVHLLESGFPILSLARFLDTADEQSEAFDIEQGAEYVLIWQFGYKTDMMVLERDEFIFMQTLKEYKSVNKALEEAIKRNKSFDFDGFWKKMLQYDVFSVE